MFLTSPLYQTIAVFGGVIYGVLYLVNSVSQGVASTKEAYVVRSSFYALGDRD